MHPHGSTSPARKTRGRIAGLVAAVLAAASLIVAPAVQVVGAAAPPTGCQLQSAEGLRSSTSSTIQFDNTHFRRDNPNVPSDLEQMPHLLNFIKDNGTLLTNDHTVLISHTATGILSSLTGVYPDRHGPARLEQLPLLHARAARAGPGSRSPTGRRRCSTRPVRHSRRRPRPT